MSAAAKGAALAMGVTMLGSYLLAYSVGKEYLQENWIEYGAMILLMLSAFLSGISANNWDNEKQIVTNLLACAIYYGVLLVITAVFFQGKYRGVGVSGLLVIAGCGLSILIKNGRHRNRRPGKRKR